jgi:hypothetical protein
VTSSTKTGFSHVLQNRGHGNGIKHASTKSLSSGQWTESDDYKQQTRDAVEGSSVFRHLADNKYILMYDVYMKGSYQFTESSDLENFNIIDEAISMNFHPVTVPLFPSPGLN